LSKIGEKQNKKMTNTKANIEAKISLTERATAEADKPLQNQGGREK